jgi:hypothetical protein
MFYELFSIYDELQYQNFFFICCSNVVYRFRLCMQGKKVAIVRVHILKIDDFRKMTVTQIYPSQSGESAVSLCGNKVI